ncbi:Alpha/Beta hydrolase protein [Fimicolochytrium jonesii]|uniref:Alpha/Beta hydrolase protein n=1 Tax=Fimicolochytrium jonesii TaxID=1396493 RepID=UPI0022FE5304|nr:Alpha/Beta hydrolase protein [Fimicolochytrium jonesii]KAI8815717.1 Alpha/Beta hydrolase protein [Fimicolochytrium jonesii]
MATNLSSPTDVALQQAASAEPLRELFPPIEPYDSGFLKVSDVHTIYWEVSGNPNGKAVVYLHGGPGGGTSPSDRRYFDPATYKIVVFDQRGAGKSTPLACLEENTTWTLIDDIETIRNHLKIDNWVVFGGSWGSTLALSYSITHPDKVKALILRGIFMLRQSELKFFYQDGASHLFPDYWDGYLAPIPPSEHSDLMAAYHRRLTGSDEHEKLACAKAWSKWECATSRLYVDKVNVEKAEKDNFALAFARIECHYFVNKGFFDRDDWILHNIPKIQHIPCFIAQGRYDVVCPARSAYDLKKRWPEAELHIVPDAGHSAKEDGIRSLLVGAAEKFKNL